MATTITCPKCGLQGDVAEQDSTAATQCPRCDTVIPAAPPITAPAPPITPPPPALNGNREAFARDLDQFFASAFVQRPRGPAPMPPIAGNFAAVELPPRPPPDPHTDPRAEREWLREEQQRLQAYMQRQFSLLQQQRQEFDGWRSQVEATLVAREQELSLQKKILASRQETLEQREAAQIEQLERLKQEDQQRAQGRKDAEKARQEVATERANLAELRATTEALKADYLALENAARERKQIEETEQAQTQRQRQQWQDSLAEMERAVGILTQREREVQELETQIHAELERQEQDLARQRRELQEWRDRVVQESCEKDLLRRKVGILARELEHLRARLARGSEAPPSR